VQRVSSVDTKNIVLKLKTWIDSKNSKYNEDMWLQEYYRLEARTFCICIIYMKSCLLIVCVFPRKKGSTWKTSSDTQVHPNKNTKIIAKKSVTQNRDLLLLEVDLQISV
jgi:hypothetical protein